MAIRSNLLPPYRCLMEAVQVLTVVTYGALLLVHQELNIRQENARFTALAAVLQACRDCRNASPSSSSPFGRQGADHTQQHHPGFAQTSSDYSCDLWLGSCGAPTSEAFDPTFTLRMTAYTWCAPSGSRGGTMKRTVMSQTTRTAQTPQNPTGLNHGRLVVCSILCRKTRINM